MKNRCMRVLALVFVTVLGFTLIVSAAGELSRTAYLSATAAYTQTSKVASEAGLTKIKGKTTNEVAAKFTILRYINQSVYTGVYTSSALVTCETQYTNYNGLAYAGYMQPAYVTYGAVGEVTIYAK